MAAQRTSSGVANKRRGKKRQSRTEVSSSSESDSDSDSSAPSQKNGHGKSLANSSSPSSEHTPEPISAPAKKSKKKSKPAAVDDAASQKKVSAKSKTTSPSSSETPESIAAPVKKSKKKSKPTPVEDEDVSMVDVPPAPAPASKNSRVPSNPTEDFSAIYLRKIAAELADDIDKVREAQDFKANSVPMLIRALKQGESMFTVEEKRRVVGVARH